MSNKLLDKIIQTKLWTDKYAPNKLSDLILHSVTKKKILDLKRNPSNCIFIGGSGCGKTKTAIILAKNIIPEEYSKSIFLNLNALDDRGLNLINNVLNPFIKKKFEKFPIKLIIINEANTITPKAQNQIAYLMEQYSNCKFIFIASELNNIFDTIQSRCSILYFPQLLNQQIEDKLKYINQEEELNLSDKCLKTIVDITQRDLRQAINFLQVVSFIKNKNITPEIIYQLFDKPNIEVTKNILTNLKLKNKKAILVIVKDIMNKGYSPNYVLLAILNFIFNCPEKDFNEILTKDFLVQVYQITSQYYIKINQGIETWTQVFGCLAEIINL